MVICFLHLNKSNQVVTPTLLQCLVYSVENSDLRWSFELVTLWLPQYSQQEKNISKVIFLELISRATTTKMRTFIYLIFKQKSFTLEKSRMVILAVHFADALLMLRIFSLCRFKSPLNWPLTVWGSAHLLLQIPWHSLQLAPVLNYSGCLVRSSSLFLNSHVKSWGKLVVFFSCYSLYLSTSYQESIEFCCKLNAQFSKW